MRRWQFSEVQKNSKPMAEQGTAGSLIKNMKTASQVEIPSPKEKWTVIKVPVVYT